VAQDRGLPSGTVTFLFTDIEGSTDLLKRLGRDRYENVLAEHSRILRDAVADHDGRVVDTQGDSLFCVFRSARDAVSATLESQDALAEYAWPDDVGVRVRMGLHSGEPKASDAGYVGIGVHRAARVGAAAHGGQVLLSETARALVADDLPPGVSLRDLGLHRLKDLDEPARLYQVVAPGLADRFPPPRTLRRRRTSRTRLVLLAIGLVVAGGGVAAVLLAAGSTAAKPVRLVANSIAVVDPKSGKPVADVALGFAPTAVDAGGEDVWVLNTPARTATAIDPTTLEVGRTVGIQGNPDSQYAFGGTDWVAFAGGVDEIDSGGAHKIALWRPGATTHTSLDGTLCFAYVTGNGRNVWVSEGRDVAVIDAVGGNVLRKLRLPAAPGYPPSLTCYGLRYSGGALVAIRNPDFSIGTVDLSSNSYTPIATTPSLNTQQSFNSANWAAGFGSYWVGATTPNSKTGLAENNLTRFDPTSGGVTGRFVVASGFFNLVVDPASGVWGIGHVPGATFAQSIESAVAVRADPSSGQVTETIRLHHLPCCPQGSVGNGVAVGHGRLWIALDSP
jgi:class 3 adenylate cyclase